VSDKGLTVHELLRELRAATERMSKTNPHRALMLHSMSALMQLAARVQDKPEAERPRVELAYR
jgi:hypothetical protein